MIPRADAQQLAEFERKLGAAAKQVCPLYGVDPQECIDDAAKATVFGKFALHNNYFNMDGDGDLGHNFLMRSMPTGNVANGGYAVNMRKLAKFSSPTAAVKEYCIRRQRGQQYVG